MQWFVIFKMMSPKKKKKRQTKREGGHFVLSSLQCSVIIFRNIGRMYYSLRLHCCAIFKHEKDCETNLNM